MAKKKRVSKKTKQSWRKHTDIKDVENFLEEKRLEERIGKVEAKPSNELFSIDTKPSTKRPKYVLRKTKRNLIANSRPKCFTLLQPLTKVPDPITKRNRVRTKEERKDRIVKSIEENRKLRGVKKAKDKVAAQNRIVNQIKKIAETYKIGDCNDDLWNIEEIDPIAVPDKQWLTNDTIRHNKHGVGKLRKRIPKILGKKTSLIPPVESPHPGQSYNPTLKDHKELLNEIVEKEKEIIKEKQHIERVTSRMFAKSTIALKEASWLTEMSEGLPNQADNEPESDSEFKSINPPAKNIKKDKKQRRKQKEQREQQKQIMLKKIEKKKVADIYKLKKLKKTIESHDKKVEMLQAKRDKAKKLDALKPKQLCSVKFQDVDLAFNQAKDIAGNLRNIKTEGSLLFERFKSLQKRNILQPTVQQGAKKRGKVKKFEPATHKMGWESKGY